MKTINIALDVSGSITNNILLPKLESINFGEFDKINFIQFTDEVTKFVILEHREDILLELRLLGGGTIIQSAIDFIVNNKFNSNKTYIISDFYADKPDYSVLGDYELIIID